MLFKALPCSTLPLSLAPPCAARTAVRTRTQPEGAGRHQEEADAREQREATLLAELRALEDRLQRIAALAAVCRGEAERIVKKTVTR